MRRPLVPSITRKPPGRDERLAFDVDDCLLNDPDTWDEVLAVLASMTTRRRALWALELAMAAPNGARIRLLRELKERLTTQSSAAAKTA